MDQKQSSDIAKPYIIGGAAAISAIGPAVAMVVIPTMIIVANRLDAWTQSMAMVSENGNSELLAAIERGDFVNGSKRYVPEGVMLVCSTGTTPAKLVVSSQSTVKIASGKLMATLPDRMDCNLNCAKMVIMGAVIGAILAVVAVAVIAFTGGLAIGALAAIGIGAVAGAGQLSSMIPCICGMLTSAPWMPVHPTTKICGNMALIESSKLTCFLGGTVMIFYSPEAAQMEADRNSTSMWCDLSLVVNWRVRYCLSNRMCISYWRITINNRGDRDSQHTSEPTPFHIFLLSIFDIHHSLEAE